jgi:hypothetical protein
MEFRLVLLHGGLRNILNVHDQMLFTLNVVVVMHTSRLASLLSSLR